MAEAIDENTIRRYLLGGVAEAEAAAFETRLMTDDGLFEMLLIVEDELMDERAAGELSAEEQARFDAYFLTTPQRRERLELARALHDYAARRADAPEILQRPVSNGTDNLAAPATPPAEASDSVIKNFPPAVREIRERRQSWTRAYLGFAAAAVVLIGIGFGIFGIWRTFFYESDVSKGLQALNQAYSNQRPTAARITGFNYAPLPPNTRGDQKESVNYVAHDRAERLLRDAVADHPDAQSYHALGRLYLAERKFDDAIKQFDEALKLNADNAQLESDLGAAYLEGGAASRPEEPGAKRSEYFEQSLKHLTRALELDDSLLQARFNRALLYGYMGRTQEARDEWRKYLERDGNSQWAAEAGQRLKSLEK